MLGLDRLCQPRVLSPQLKFQGATLHREPLLQGFKARLLARVERQLMVQNIVQFGAGLGRRGEQYAADEYAAELALLASRAWPGAVGLEYRPRGDTSAGLAWLSPASG